MQSRTVCMINVLTESNSALILCIMLLFHY